MTEPTVAEIIRILEVDKDGLWVVPTVEELRALITSHKALAKTLEDVQAAIINGRIVHTFERELWAAQIARALKADGVK